MYGQFWWWILGDLATLSDLPPRMEVCIRDEMGGAASWKNGKLTGGCVPPQSFLTTNAARFLRETTRRRDASTLARFGTLQRDG